MLINKEFIPPTIFYLLVNCLNFLGRNMKMHLEEKTIILNVKER